MKSRHIWCRLLWGALLMLSCAPVAAAQHDASRDKQQNPIKVHADIPWRKFLVEDVPYIITDEERAAATKLTTDQQRENFILKFWERRNPNLGWPENAFEEENYRRIAYANEQFAANVSGWKTDRGHTYIIYGPPNSVKSSHRRSPLKYGAMYPFGG